MLTPAPLLLVAFALHAQSADFLLLGKDHAKFARELYEAGYVELAETLCTRIENSPNADPAEVASVRSVHLDLKIAQARTQKDPRAKLTAMTQLLKQKEEFIEAYPDAPEARDALQTLPDVYAAVGEAFAEAVKAVQEDPGEAKRLRAEGSDIFRRGEAALADQVEQLTAAADEPDLPPEQAEAIDLDLMAAKYNLARTFFFHATLLGKDDPFGETFLDRSIDAFEEFGLLYSDRLLYFEGQVFQGQAHAAKGETDDALASFDECIGLKDTFGEDEPMPAVTIQVVAWGIQKKIELLTELKRYEDAIATADDFLETVPGAAATRHDLAVLDARMTAEVASGDSAAAQATAQLLVDKDPNGWYGDRGQAILGNLVASGSAGGLGQKNLLKIAQSLAAKKDYEQALKLAHQAIAASRSASGPPEDLAEAFVLAGGCNWGLNRFEEASVAYDAGYESNPTGEKAPDALSYASLAYDELYKRTRRTAFEKRSEQRLQQLATRFPRDRRAGSLSLSQAKKLANNEEYAAAAEAYLRIQPDSGAYPDAQLGAATSLYSEAVRLSKEKSPEVKAAAAKAEAQLRKAQSVLASAAGKTLDLEEKAAMEANAIQAVSLIGSLYMLEGVGRQNDVLALTKEIEEQYAGNEAMIGEARSLKVRALTALGKVVEAEDYLEGLIAADPDSRSTALAAGVLARTLDQQATELFAKDEHSAAGGDLWEQAFRYYVMSLKPKLDDSRAGTEIEQVATRLVVMGEHFNGVPKGVTSFVGLKELRKPVAPEYWEQAASFYESAIAKSSSFNAKINLARTLGYLGRFAEAVDVYSEVVENETLIDPSTNEINRDALTGRPELLSVYLELGVAQFEVGRTERSDADIESASAIFARIVKAAPKQASESWWRARYYQLASWYELGNYKTCLAAINDLERNSEDFDEARWGLGLSARFKELKRETERKLP